MIAKYNIIVITFLIILLGSGCTRSLGKPNLSSTKQLLQEYRTETLSSDINPSKPSVLGEFRKLKPEKELLLLYRQRDKTVLDLGGTFWGIVCKEVNPSAFVPSLIKDLNHNDPRMRAFACDALGYLDEQSPVPYLKEKLEDKIIVPGYAGNPPVAVFAASALAFLGHPDGIKILLAHAENDPEYWHIWGLPHFKWFSNKDFGKDLQQWKNWFKDNPPKVKMRSKD